MDKELINMLAALCYVWHEFYQSESGHAHTAAGENVMRILVKYGLLKNVTDVGGQVDWDKLNEYIFYK